MISWIKNLLGLNTPIEKKKIELSSIRHQAFYATRNGNLRKAGELSKKYIFPFSLDSIISA